MTRTTRGFFPETPMTQPEPPPPPAPAPYERSGASVPAGLRKAFGCVAVVAALVGAAVAISRCEDARQARVRRALQKIQQEHGGRIAWFDDGGRVRWRDLGTGGRLGEVSSVDPGLKPVRVAWSSDGAAIYAVVESGAFDKVHRIISVNPATKEIRTILDLAAAKLEDDDIDAGEFWVAAHGDAESEQDRITFRLGKGYWYSVEGKRPRVRPAAGPPERKWDQERCPDGRHRLVHRSNDDDSWIELEGGDEDVGVTPKDARAHPAWWCPQHP
ncbi:MAG: hypothetical protein IT452_23020 [Planctomycetia bacterium]|nr:hypothetical protein [Planctomycetia bacterium]